MRANTLKPEPRKCSETSCITIGLRRSGLSVPYLRKASANGIRGQFLVTGLPLAKSSNTPVITGSIAANTSSCVDESSSRRRADRTRPAAGRRADPRRGNTARSGNSGRSPTSSAAACTAAAPAAARRTCPDGSGRHQEVARAFRRRRRQDRGLELEEALRPSCACASNRRCAPRVMMFWCSLSRRRSRKRYLSLISSGYSCSPNTGSGNSPAGPSTSISVMKSSTAPVGNSAFSVPSGRSPHLAVDPHHPLRAQLLGVLEGRRIRIDHALGQAVMVAQIDEQQPAMVADAMAPAGQAGGLVDIALAERAAGVGPVAVHGHPETWSEVESRGSAALPRSDRVYPSRTGAATE